MTRRGLGIAVARVGTREPRTARPRVGAHGSWRLRTIMAAGVLALASVAAPVSAGEAEQNPILELLQAYAEGFDLDLVVDGNVVSVSDPAGDVTGYDAGGNDVVQASYAWLPMVDPRLLDGPFNCDTPNVACDNEETDRFGQGAWLFHGRRAMPYNGVPAGVRVEFGPVLALMQYPTAPVQPGNPFGGSSHAVITRIEGGMGEVHYFGLTGGSFQEFNTQTRSTWTATDWFMLVPADTEVQREPTGWDVYSYYSDGTQEMTGRDNLRGFDGEPLLAWGPTASIEFQQAAPTTAPTAGPIATVGQATAAPASAAPTPAASGSGAPIAGSGFDPFFLIILVLALILILLGWWLFRGGGRRSDPAPTEPTPPVDPGPTRPARPGPPAAPPPGPGGGDDGTPTGPGGRVVGDPGMPPPPPPPPPRNCVEGDEEWRNDKPASTFLIAPADARVRLTTDPTTPELEAWMAQFGFPHGAIAAAFVAVDDAELDALLAGLPEGPTTFHWVFEFELREYHLECQRKWRCENDAWVPTNETRLVEGGPNAYAGRFPVDGPTRTRGDVRAAWLQVKAALAGASAAEAAMDAYRKAC